MIPQQSPLLTEPPSTPPPPSPRRGEGLLIGLAALAGAAVVLLGLISFQQWRDGADSVAAVASEEDGGSQQNSPPTSGTTTSPTTSGSTTRTQPSTTEQDPGSTLAPAPSAEPGTGNEPEAAEGSEAAVETVRCPTQFDAVICDAAEFVQQTRGRPFKRFPNVELLDDTAFDLALVEDLDEAREDLIRQERLLKSLGLIPLDLDMFTTFESLIQSGVVGFYDPDTERLVVRGGEFDLYGQSVLVHELVHAFDDQWFDLGRDDFEDDAEYGFLAVIEGNASRVEELWKAGLSTDEAAELQQLEFGALSAEDLSFLLSLPEVILTLQISPYEDGQIYVNSLARQGGESAIDDKLAVPPESSEQVLHPGASEAANTPVPVEVPSAVGLLIDDGTIGELLIRSWLGPRAAQGWGGDRYVTWEAGSQTCFAAHLAADSNTDLEEMNQAALRWSSEAPSDRQVELIDGADRSTVRVSGCY